MNSSAALNLEKLAEELSANHRHFMTSLVNARNRAGLTQAEVAFRMGVSQASVSQFERYDSNPTLATIRRYALAVGVGLRDDVLYSLGQNDWRELAQWRLTEREDSLDPEPIRSDWVMSTRERSPEPCHA